MASESASRRRPPTRLQRRAPTSIQTNRSTQWNAVAIPLLSPVSSPPIPFDQAAQLDSRKTDGQHQAFATAVGSDQKPAVVFKKWQAAPFRYESGPAASFSRSDGSRR